MSTDVKGKKKTEIQELHEAYVVRAKPAGEEPPTPAPKKTKAKD